MENEEVLGLNLIVIAPLLVNLIGLQPREMVETYVSRVDAQFQEQFRDLTLVEKGFVGMSRLDRVVITKHGGGATPRAIVKKDIRMAVFIFGNEGKKLEFTSIKKRFERPAIGGDERVEFEQRDPTLKEAIKRFQNSKVNSVVVKRGVVRWELRPVRLSKKECLSCHKGMMLGNPVAVMTYGTAPSKSDKPFPR